MVSSLSRSAVLGRSFCCQVSLLACRQPQALATRLPPMNGRHHKSKGPSPPQGRQQVARTRISGSSTGPRVRHAPIQQRARATVDAIIEAAGQLLVTQGRSALTTNAVAERAGVSIGSLYQYFPNKDAIFEALQEKHRDQVMPLVQHTLDNLAAEPSVDLLDGIVALMRAMVELHQGNPARMRALLEELHEESSAEDAEALVDKVTAILAARSREPAHRLRATAWLACLTVSQVGRTLVHQPPSLDSEEILAGLARMLRGLLDAVLV
jgi:AcrR family transcriptional regulator